MQAEVIAIGDELTSGQRLDTNSQWLSQQLADLGIRVLYHSTVGDEIQPGAEVFRLAMERADVIVATGGLGPTADDLTRDAIASACGVDLVLDEAMLAHIERLFASRGRPMPEWNRIQAMLPRGSVAIPNPHGTAPGIQMIIQKPTGEKVMLFALPGVPAEMKEMWEQTIVPALRSVQAAPRVIRHHVIRCFGVGESDLEQRLPDIIRRGRRPSVGITVSEATISLRISAEGADDSECRKLVEPTRQIIHDCLGKLVFGEGEDELQHVVMRLLREHKQSLSVCEWGTRGLVSRWLAEVQSFEPGVYRGAYVVSDGEALEALMGEPANPHTSPSILVSAMADHCRRTFKSSLGLAIGPWPSTEGSSEAERIFLAVSADGETRTRSAITAGHPEVVQPRAAKQALDFVRYWLLERGPDHQRSSPDESS